MKYSILTTCFIITVSSVFAGEAEDILKASGVQGGLVVHIGCGDGKLTAALHANDSFLVHGLDVDEVNVVKARKSIKTLGLCGKVTADPWDGKALPYIDNLANLVVLSDAGSGLSEQEILRILVPNGIALISKKGNEHIISTINRSGLHPSGALSYSDRQPSTTDLNYMKLTKPWPNEIDEWTHWLHGPGNNAVSNDTRVGIARHLQWIADPLWGRHHNLVPSMSIMVSANGRIYYIIDEAPISVRGPTDNWALVCRDAFNGMLLWKIPIKNWGWKRWSAVEFDGVMRFKRPDQLFRRLVAVGDTVFVTLGFNEPVVALDGASGKVIREYEDTENTAAILFKNNTLYLARNVLADKPGKDILAIDAETGEKLWERKGYRGITSRGDELKAFMDAYLTVGDNTVFFLNDNDILALDMKSGKELWRTPRPEMKKDVFGHYQFNFMNFCALVYHENKVFLGQFNPEPTNLNKWQQKDMALWALDAGTGKKLWEHQGMSLAHFTPPDLFVNNGMVWTMRKDVVSLVGLDVETGKVNKEYPVKDMLVGHHHRCYRNKATRNLYLAGEEGIEYISFETGELDVHHWIRGACAYGILPANGLIYLPTHACGCHSNAKLHGFLALATNPHQAPAPETPRLQKGPAYGSEAATINHEQSSSWPIYKHDNGRSNCATTNIPREMGQKWIASIGEGLTAPVIAGQRVYLASQDSNRVYCLDAGTGKVVWQFTTDGPIDSPPTFYKGILVFGSRAGSVYALKADDGRLVWRFRAAPGSVRIVAFGRLESVWPVIGSTLVMDDKVYCVAGRSMNLNGGMYAYELDLVTGKVLHELHLEADQEVKGECKDAVLPDILVNDGANVYMRGLRLQFGDTLQKPAKNRGFSGLRPNDGGLLDGTWFNSNFWKYRTASAQMLVFDEATVYGIMAQKKLVPKSYGQDIFTLGSGYSIFAVDLNAKSAERKEPVQGKSTGRKKGKTAAAKKWQSTSSVRAQAMILAGRYLCLAGAPDVVSRDDSWAAFDDHEGGMLEVYSKSHGKKTSAYKLASTPIYDGMAAANGKLFISLENGSIVCYGGK